MQSLKRSHKVPVEMQGLFLFFSLFNKMKIHSILLAILVTTGTSFAQDEEPANPWNISVGSRYMNRYTNYGLDLSQDRAALGYDLTVAHENGFSLSAGTVQTLGTGSALQQWSVGLGYEWRVSESFLLSGEYTHYAYADDSVNVLAALSNGVSFSAELSLDVVDVGFSYDTFLGTNSASYFSLDLSSFHQFSNITILPFAQITFMSQSVENRFLKTNKTGMGKGGPPSNSTTSTSSVTTVTGLSNFSVHLVLIYPIVDRLSISFHPSYQYSPKAEVAARTSQFIWSAGLRYSFDF